MAKVGRMVKESMVQETAARFAERPNFFITSVGRLPSAETDGLRQKLHGSQASLVVIKRRLGLLATKPLQVGGLDQLLEGSVGLVLAGEDILAVAKVLVEFRKAHEERLTVRGAVIDGQLLDTVRVEQLAQLPPKPVLLAQVVATIESPIAQLILTIEQLIGDVAWIAEQAAVKREETGDKRQETGDGKPETGDPKTAP